MSTEPSITRIHLSRKDPSHLKSSQSRASRETQRCPHWIYMFEHFVLVEKLNKRRMPVLVCIHLKLADLNLDIDYCGANLPFCNHGQRALSSVSRDKKDDSTGIIFLYLCFLFQARLSNSIFD